MERMSKVSLTMLVLMLGIFVAAGTANAVCSCGTPPGAVPCPGGNGFSVAFPANAAYTCGDVVTMSCTFEADLDCGPAPGLNTRHGLIVGAPGAPGAPLIIDGAGYQIDGGGTAGRNCEVAMVPGDPDGECLDHPCRYAAFDSGVIDSGIVNAQTTLGGGCSATAPLAEGGCDDVTVTNLEITGFCDGIFMCGDCTTGAGHTRAGAGLIGNPAVPAEMEYRLSGIEILGNVIQNNGRDCGVLDLNNNICAFPEKNFNDGIFLAQAGTNAGAEGEEYARANAACLPPCSKPEICYSGAHGDLPENAVLVRHNVIKHQKGCACENCPGGSAVNLNGGIEDLSPDGWDRTYDVWYSGCVEVAKNKIMDIGFSGIQFHHGTVWNRIHGNYVADCGYGGVISGCDWLFDNHIYSNFVEDVFGPGYGYRCQVNLWNNVSFSNKDTTLVTDWPTGGTGVHLLCPVELGVAGGAVGSCIVDNNLLCNETADMMASASCQDPAVQGEVTADLNECLNMLYLCDATAFDDTDCRNAAGGQGGCTYRYPLLSGTDGLCAYLGKRNASRCVADISSMAGTPDGMVNAFDKIKMAQQWLWGVGGNPPCVQTQK